MTHIILLSINKPQLLLSPLPRVLLTHPPSLSPSIHPINSLGGNTTFSYNPIIINAFSYVQQADLPAVAVWLVQ